MQITQEDILTAQTLLSGTGISLIDAARIIRNILDARPKSSKIVSIEFCHKVVETGKRNLRTKEMSFEEGLELYIKSKAHLRKDSLRDIKYLSNRLKKSCPDLAKRNFSELSPADCETWLTETFTTSSHFKQSANERCISNDPKDETVYEVNASQFNKGRTILHALFEFAFRHEWCNRNPVKLVERKKVIEKEITPLSIDETKRIIKTAQCNKHKACMPAIGILLFAGIRPREVRRLKWGDIDLAENSITVRSQCSKTGGVRSVEICPTLKSILQSAKITDLNTHICPPNWTQRWKEIRNASGFKNNWTQDCLRHTYASFHAKYYRDLPRLQLNMGHRDLSLLQSRYINMHGISSSDARTFFYKPN